MSNERRIKTLKNRHKSLLASLTSIKTFVDSYEEERDQNEIPLRLESLNKLWADFILVQNDLESLDEAAIDEHIKHRAEYESFYYRIKGFLLATNKHVSTPTLPSPNSSTRFPATTSSSHVRLPDVKLPVFNGNLDNWLNFHDLYLSLVHSSADLSNIQKFYYLRSSLSDEALKLIQTIPLSATNYPVAWNMLVNHFQNPSRLKQAYVNSLFEHSAIKKESATELHSLVERFEANVKMLKQLGEETEHWDVLLIHMLSARLDPTTRRDWEEFSSNQANIGFKDLTTFIQRRVNVLQTLQGKPAKQPPTNTAKKPSFRPVSSHGATQGSVRKCVMCPDQHPLYMCGTFSKLSIDDKEKEVRRHQLCRNCLRKGHLSKDCSSSSNCRKCRGRHHSQLCAHESSTLVNQKSKSATTPPSEESLKVSLPASVPETVSYAASGQLRKTVLLATALIIIVDDQGIEHLARALLDSGSECCFISETLSQRIKAQRKKIYLPVAGIGNTSTKARYKFLSTIRSRVGEYSTSVEFLVLPQVTMGLPSAPVDTSSWVMPPGIELADPSFDATNPVDVILGAEIFFDLFKVAGRIALGENLPVLINSVLGWVVSGKSASGQPPSSVVANVATVDELHTLLETFWTIEEGHNTPAYSVEEAACEEHFRRTVSRTPEGRYVVRLPFKGDVLGHLGDNRRTALRRCHLLESRLARNPDQHQQYQAFMEEYHSLGHMRLVGEEEPPAHTYHLPHHAVVREESTTTKLRVVFDASCKTSSGKSLNDTLMIGPVVQEDLRSIIMRSRKHPIMLIADIKQMYRQVLVDPADTPYQRIVWRSSPDQPMATYELNTVTYGTASAPFLATRVLKQLAEDERSNFPAAAEVLVRDFYMDDLFSGGKTPEEVAELRIQLDSLLAKGGFQLRKWASNNEAVLEGVDPENRALQTSVDLDRDQVIKTLGLHWEPAHDQLRYRIQVPSMSLHDSLTKRLALSQIARLFDPLGLVGPVLTTAKLYMQHLWTLKDENGNIWDWDDELPASLKEQWIAYQTQLPQLNELRIERCILCTDPRTIQFHFFSDASQLAYGACVYVRSTSASGFTNVSLLTAKSKVAPLKKQSIPRLELCGALMSAELHEKVTSSLQLKAECFFWVDSTTVLCWLNATPSTWNTFVANRISKIQLATQNCHWNHVAGQENPADLISRGTTAETLLQSDLWWRGPSWLVLDESHWPNQQRTSEDQPDALQEARKPPAVSATTGSNPSFIDLFVENFSHYDRLTRTAAHLRRFIVWLGDRNSLSESAEQTILSCDEVGSAEAAVLRLVQQQSFPEEWKLLQQSKPVSQKSRLKWFHPFIAPDQLIRIGGRLDRSQQPYDSKHQIILPGSHALSVLLVRKYHEQNLHAAPQLLLALLRQRYWLIGARSLAKRVVHNCVICSRARPKMVEQFMAELPASRVIASRPFTSTGIDYWGPILLQAVHRRAGPRKAYVALFVCFCTKAVHIELVPDLSTAKFLQALRRFVSRRGLCSDLYSDNGRNFVGAANELRQLINSNNHRDGIARECTEQGIRWHFNPPKASHFGGLWESAINSAQKHFIRVLGPLTLAQDDMHTLLCQIESCLNSRPLVPLSDDPSDYEPLTPGHFLVGSALKGVPDRDYTSVPTNRLRKWQQVQQLFQHLWKRWHSEYLSTLQARTKWCNPPVKLELDQLVIVKDENTPPMLWPTARIHQLHPGADGVVRVVTVQTPTGCFVRPVSKICLLPIAPSSSSQNQPTASSSEPPK